MVLDTGRLTEYLRQTLLIQPTDEAIPATDGIGTIIGAATILLILVLILLQTQTERNLWNFLARMDGIGLLAVGTSLSIVLTIFGRDFQKVRIWGAFLGGTIVLLVAWRSDYVDSLAEYGAWLTVQGALRMVMVVVMGLSALALLFGRAVTIQTYLGSFPIAGFFILASVALLPVDELKEMEFD